MNGKRLLLFFEQGFGDGIFMIRYAREIKRRWPACQVWTYSHTLLCRLLESCDGVDRAFDFFTEPTGYLTRGESEEQFLPDYYVPIMSLPHRFGTTIETVPAEVPYIHAPELYIYPERMNTLGLSCGIQKIGEEWKRIRPIGLVWAGSPRHGKDRFRSTPPEIWQPLIDAHPECQFYSLQVGPRQDEVKRLRNVIDMAPAICAVGDWTATAQVVAQLDAICCVDTAVAHLAGAMAKRVLVAIPKSPDFRWGLNGERSVFYPTMTLVRQTVETDWSSVVQRISEIL